MALRFLRSHVKAGLLLCGMISLFSVAMLFSSVNIKHRVLEKVKTLSRRAGTAKQVEISKIPLSEAPLVVIYNRIPKTGSTTFANIAYSLASPNHFSVIHVNVTHNVHTMSPKDQMLFCHNVTIWTERQPALYHGHFAYINFEQFGPLDKFTHIHPVYINVVRDPIDRLISYFYFLRHGDDFRPGLRRKKAGRNDTFDQCVVAEGKDCEPRLLWKQIPFFCGHSVECWEPGNPWALEQAKVNLATRYLAVGTLDQMKAFVRLVEVLLPRYFGGAIELLESGQMGGDHLRRTTTKILPKNSTIEKFKRMAGHVWRMENEFYEFARRHFAHSYAQVFGFMSSIKAVPTQFHFEKIRPKKIHKNWSSLN